METLNIDKEKVINAYKQGSEKEKEVLELLFGVETFRQKTIMDKVKTFDDALKELGLGHPFVKEYDCLCNAEISEHLIDYSWLCIITAALNEGWTPKFIEGECQYFPYFKVDIKGDLLYAGTGGGSEVVAANVGCRLAFKTRELAEYAGKQFTELYADYLLNTNNA